MTEKYTTQTKCCSSDLKGPPQCCCVDTYRIYDSCIGQECLRGLRVYVTECGQAVLNNTNALRITDLSVLWTQVLSEEVPFRAGYYNITVRYYFVVTLECCQGLGNSKTVHGICCYEKNVLLYGGEGKVSVFTSDTHQAFCASPPMFHHIHQTTNAPRVVVEVAAPVGLEVNLICGLLDTNETCCDIPQEIACQFEGSFDKCCCIEKSAYITIGIFTIIRVERPAQLMMECCENCFPDKTCCKNLSCSDPCTLFNSMAFPYSEFAPVPEGRLMDLTSDRSSADPTMDPTLFK